MLKHDYYKRRARSRLNSFLAMGGLVLWAGVIIAAWLSVEPPPPEAPASMPPPREIAMEPRERSTGQDARPPSLIQQDANGTGPSAQRTAAPGGDGARRVAEAKVPPRAGTGAGPKPEPEAGPEPEGAGSGAPPRPASSGQAADSPGDAPAAAEPAANPPAPAPAPEEVSSPHVGRAQFTVDVVDREPINRVGPVFHSENQQLRRLYYFTEIKGLSGETVTHRWELEGRVIARVSFEIGGDYWRVYSSKKLIPAMEGRWRVFVTDSQGRTLKTDSFVYKVP